jgi:hypothetical protein
MFTLVDVYELSEVIPACEPWEWFSLLQQRGLKGKYPLGKEN